MVVKMKTRMKIFMKGGVISDSKGGKDCHRYLVS